MDYMTFISENYVIIILVSVIILMTIIGYFADKKYTKNPVGKSKKKENKKVNEDLEESIDNDFDAPTSVEPIVDNFESYSEPVMDENLDEVKEEVQPEPVVENIDTFDEPVVEEVQPEPVVEDAPVEVADSFETPANEENVDEVNEEVTETTADAQSTEEVVEETPITEEEPVEEIKEDALEEVKPVEPEDWNNMEDSNITLDANDSVSSDIEEEPSEWTTINEVVDSSEDTNSSDNITFDGGLADEDFKLPNIDKLNDELASVEDDDDVWKF